MEAKPQETAWDSEADVVVVGFGAAGACAAIEASRQGVTVLAVDRFHGGGATAASGGIVYAGGGTRQQRQAGCEDTPERMYAYLKLEVGDAVSDATLRRFCEGSRGDLLWLEELGVPFEGSLCPFKTSYPTDHYYLYFSGNELVSYYRTDARPAPRGHRARGKGISGRGLFSALQTAAGGHGIQVYTQVHVQRLVISPEGRVTGVEGRAIPQSSAWAGIHRRLSKVNAKAITYIPPVARQISALLRVISERHSQPFRARAGRGVVLAAGGFVGNADMLREHAPLYLRCRPLGTDGDDGTGIRLGQSAGGATARMDRVTGWRFYVPPEVLMRGVLVNRNGERVCNEDLYGATVVEKMMSHGGDAYLVFDSQTYHEAVHALRVQAAPFQMLAMLPMLLVGRKKASTIGGLAAKIRASPEGLQATLSRYNALAREHMPDPMGKAPEYVVPQDKPPFYAMDCSLDSTNGVPCAALTLGGLVVDEVTGQVLREDGSPVQGLYAAGRNAVGICSQSYVSGLSIADCVFSGRRAGYHAAMQASPSAPGSRV